MFEGVLDVVTADPPSIGRGRDTLRDALVDLLEDGCAKPELPPSVPSVQSDRVAMPDKPGVLELEQWLSPSQLAGSMT